MAKHSLSRAHQSAVEGLFANLQILTWGSEEAAAYARTRTKLEAAGVTVALLDMLIAAQAIAAKAVLVTRDKIFKQIDDLKPMVNWATDL
jgi:tRNA(fMet)-specific endonuclease VapC